MFISVVLNTEYMDIASRSKWYLKNLYHCKKNGWILISHEYMRNHWEQLQDEITPSLFDSWEITLFSAEDVVDVEQYFLPDSLFEQLEAQCGSRTEMLYRLSSSSNEQLEAALQRIIDVIRAKHPDEKIDGMFHCLEAWKTFYNLGDKNNFPIIPYSFSAFRKPHGYRQTLYHCNLHTSLYSTTEAKNRYEKFLKNNGQSIPIFSHRELVAIFGKDRTLPLIPLMKAEPKYEMGICTECGSVIPQFFVHDKTTDDDVRYECEKLYDKSQITVRNHSLQVDYMQLDRSAVHNDPAAWILSCRRLAAARSQIGLKFLLWGRTAIMKPDTMGYAFLCEKDYASTGMVDIQALNFYLFAYLIPNDLMFSEKYWSWRMTNPDECDIYRYHLDFYARCLAIPIPVYSIQIENIRFKHLLESRGCDRDLCDKLLDDCNIGAVDFNTAISRIVINGKSHWRMNLLEGEIRHCRIEIDEPISEMAFYPLDDVAGMVVLDSVSVNGRNINVAEQQSWRYMPKQNGCYLLKMDTKKTKSQIDIGWRYMTVNDFVHLYK